MAIGLDLDQYQLKKRVLLVFAPSPADARYREQRSYLRDEEGLLNRWNVVLFGVFEDGPSFAEHRPISHEEAERARERFGFEVGEFGICLVDLDGTHILRAKEPLPADYAVDVIEERAMRRLEATAPRQPGLRRALS